MLAIQDGILRGLAVKLLGACRKAGIRMGTAESCTGGMISAILTSVAGSSDVFDGAIVSYQNRIKHSLLQVSEEILKNEGAVSKACAQAMAQGAAKTLDVELALAVTGIAGPGGGTHEKPVGLVYTAVCVHGVVSVEENYFLGDRDNVRTQTVQKVLQMALSALEASTKESH